MMPETLDVPPSPDVARAGATAALANAASFLEGKRWREAEVEILRALALVPAEARALRLLALVRFKLGRLDEAEAVCRELVAQDPQDASMRLKIGLIALKLDRPADAVRELEVAALLAPADPRVWTYLGFAHARVGATTQARVAFKRAGQEGLADQLDWPKSSLGEAVALPESVEAQGEAPEAGGALEALPLASEVFEVPGSEARAGLGEGPIVEPEVAPPEDGPALEERDAPPQPVLSLLSFALSRLGALERMPTQSGGGAVKVRFQSELHVRASAVVAISGRTKPSVAQRREQGRLSGGPLGTGADAFLRFEGDGEVALADPNGIPVTLALADDVFYVRLERLLAFDKDVLWEAGRVPRTSLDMLQFRGDGQVVVALAGHPTALKVSPQDPVIVGAERLLGWAGPVVARGLPNGLVFCEGEGVVLVELFPPAAK